MFAVCLVFLGFFFFTFFWAFILILKGEFGFFKVGFYEVLIHSRCITNSGWRSARSQFGETVGVPAQMQSNVLLWTRTAAKWSLAAYKRPHQTTVNISLSVRYIKNIFTALPCRQTALSFGTTFSQLWNFLHTSFPSVSFSLFSLHLQKFSCSHLILECKYGRIFLVIG